MHAVNTDDTYRSTAKGWTNPVALVVTPDTALPHGAAVQVNLVAGVCLSAESVLPAAVTAPFVLSADLATWKEIVAGAIDPIMAVARGKVKLASGSLGTLMLHAKSAKALVACAQQIDTSWP
jgi:putative sterol carrier protein